MNIGIFVGSLRKDSYNLKVAQELIKQFPSGVQAQIIDCVSLPFYNQDLDTQTPDNPYADFRATVKRFDAYIFVTPEYNRSVAPVLKNVLDVVSRDPEGSSWNGKPATVFSASMAAAGGIAGNLALRQVFVYLNLIPMQTPEVYLGAIHTCFEGDVLQERTALLLNKAAHAFVDHARMVNAGASL